MLHRPHLSFWTIRGHMAGRKQTNKPRQPKMPLRRGRAWFERNVAEQKAELDKLPVGRQKGLRRKLDNDRTETGRVQV